MLERLVVAIEADLSDFRKNLSAVDKSLESFGSRLQGIGKTMSAAVTLPLVGIGVAATKLAADAQEAGSKMEAVFGSAAGEMNEWIAGIRSHVPVATHELQGMASGIQDLLVPLGMSSEAAQGMTKDVVKLAADLASFNNIPMEEALEGIRAGLVGSNEPLLKFGVAINQADVKAEALRMGLIKGKEELNANARAQAAFSLIMKGTTAAQGDAAKTAQSAANQFKQFTATAKELGVMIGNNLLPVITPLIAKLTNSLRLFQTLSPAAQRNVVVVGAMAAAIGPLLVALGTFVTLLPKIKLGLLLLQGPFGIITAAVIGLTAIWVKYGDDIWRVTQETYTAIKTNLLDRFTPVVQAIGAKIEQVTGFFRGMYNAVVGNSYVPDMVDGVVTQFTKMGNKTVSSTVSLTSAVSQHFSKLKLDSTTSTNELHAQVVAKFLAMGKNVKASTDDMVYRVAEQFRRLETVGAEVTVGIAGNYSAMASVLNEEAKEVWRAQQAKKQAFEDAGGTLEKVAVKSVKAAEHMRGGVAGAFEQITGKINGAIGSLGGFLDKLGGVGGAIKDVLGGNIGGALEKIGIGGKVGKMIGDTIAGFIPGGSVAKLAIGALAPVAKDLAGKALKKVGGWVGGLFGKKKKSSTRSVSVPRMVAPTTTSAAVASAPGTGSVDASMHASLRVQQEGFRALIEQQGRMGQTMDDVRREIRNQQAAALV